jgi:hypothetical protein
MDLAAKWHGPGTISKWLRVNVHPTQGIKWYATRARAVEYFTKSVAFRMEHEAAVFAVANVEDIFKYEFTKEICRIYKEENSSMYVTRTQVTQALLKVMGKPGRGMKQRVHTRSGSTVCQTCAGLMDRIKRLEAQIRAGCKPGTEPVA